jgi:hypothetical protein
MQTRVWIALLALFSPALLQLAMTARVLKISGSDIEGVSWTWSSNNASISIAGSVPGYVHVRVLASGFSSSIFILQWI